MPSIDSLPPDQRAVLQLVLQRGRSYDEIAETLSIDRASVRQRALDALDALRPHGQAPMPPERSLITDYLLGQLPDRVAEQVYGLLASSVDDRDWAEAVSIELAFIARENLPPVPDASEVHEEYDEELEPQPAFVPVPPADADDDWMPETTPAPASGRASHRSSRDGGRVLLAIFCLAIVVSVVLIFVFGLGGSNSPNPNSVTSTTHTKTSTTTTGKTTTTGPVTLAQLNLNSPNAGDAAKGLADVVRDGDTTGLVVYATHVPANSKHNAYAVWLANSKGDAQFVGFVPKLVGKDGKLHAEGKLPADAANYKHLLITLETKAHPKHPGTTVLTGPFREHSS